MTVKEIRRINSTNNINTDKGSASFEVRSCATASGVLPTIPAKIIRDVPFPIPLSVICSPIHIRSIVPAGFTAYPRKVDFKKFREIADSCGAILMVDMSHFAGLVAGGAYASPFDYADVVTTTVHKTLRGPRSALIFSKKDDRELYKKIDKAVFPGLQGGPHLNQIAAVAVALKEAATPMFKKYAKQVEKNAEILAKELVRLGWKVISGGTDSHLVLLDTWMGGEGVSGKEASLKLEKAGIIVNKNTIPNETRSPMDPSGIRLGTAAETTRGKKEKDFVKIAQKIDKILRS
jgi:glycine hydroxymethyltransferase